MPLRIRNKTLKELADALYLQREKKTDHPMRRSNSLSGIMNTLLNTSCEEGCGNYYLQDISGRQTPQYPKKHKLCNMTKLGLRIPFTDVLKKHTKAILWKSKKSLFYWIL